MTANVAVFAVSAFFHELLISVPCHVLRLWAFLAMMYVCMYILVVSIHSLYYLCVSCVGAVVGGCVYVVCVSSSASGHFSP